MTVAYKINEQVDVESFVDLLRRSTLGERRPIDDRECMEGMLEHGNLTVTAWHEDLLVGIARSVTDFCYCCYLSDLAVDRAYQKQRIGVQLQQLTLEQLGPRCKIILLAAPAATSYYPKIGYQKHNECWVVEPGTSLGRSKS